MKDKHNMFRFTKERLKEELRLEKEKYRTLERDISRFSVVLVLIAVILLWIYASNNDLLKQGIGYMHSDGDIQEQNIVIEEL